MKDQVIFEKIDSVIEALSTSVSKVEAIDGWTPESKEVLKIFFEGLKEKLQSGDALPPMSISRAMDHWGIISGEILEKSAQISNELRSRSHIGVRSCVDVHRMYHIDCIKK